MLMIELQVEKDSGLLVANQSKATGMFIIIYYIAITSKKKK